MGGGSFCVAVRGEGCCIRNDNEGTVRLADADVGVMKRWLGSVRVPLWRAEIVTWFSRGAGAGRQGGEGDILVAELEEEGSRRGLYLTDI